MDRGHTRYDHSSEHPAELGEEPAAGGYWTDQTDEQRAAVVAAVYAAARGEC